MVHAGRSRLNGLKRELDRAKNQYERITSLYLHVDSRDTTAPSGDRLRFMKLLYEFSTAADRYTRALVALQASRGD
jgi:hypothetical protein